MGSGWTIFNNKGKPVRQYEPFFSGDQGFEFARRVGVSPILFYDPVERVVATLHPNHAWEKVAFDPWRQETWDVNDTVLHVDPRNDPDVGEFFHRLPDVEYLPTWIAQRQGGGMGAREQAAADKAATHAETPTVTQFDTLGRPFLTVAHNRFARNGEMVQEQYETRISLDIEGNQREVSDARTRIVMSYEYDMLGDQIHSSSMEAGELWMLNDVAGQPIRAWDSRGHVFRTEYDELRRPTRSFVTGADANHPDREILFERTVYGEGQGAALNHRGRAFQVFDGAGVVTNEEYDFKGNLLSGSRQLLVSYRDAADWSLNLALESEVFTSSTIYDALNRPILLTTPDNSRIHPFYNEANLLERVEAHLPGADTATTVVNDIDYNARGQRELIEYGNGVRTTYEYDQPTFRLTRLLTLRTAEPLQDLTYTYDPVGNITDIRDEAQQTIYFNNQVVEPHAEYTYDAIYRLIEASGREHIGQVSQPQTSWNDEFRVNLPHPNHGQAMRRYAERYEHDEVGNILRLIHQATSGDWTRVYAYNEPSLIEPALTNNRLSQTQVGASIETYTHDEHGAMTRMAHLPLMRWNYLNQLEATSRQVVNTGIPETTYYVYDAAGQRARKVTERQSDAGQTSTRWNERIYLGGFEIYREYGVDGTTTTLERQTLHIMDDQQRVALVETLVQGDDGSPAQVIRYQLASHLGSASLELGEAGQIISYEEFYPYGDTSYQAVRNDVEVNPKRYRYTGKERDEETGFCYHGSRYYAAWLGRWTTADPIGLVDGVNRYQYGRDNPIVFMDSNGEYARNGPNDDDESVATEHHFVGYEHIPGVGEEPPPPVKFVNFEDDHVKVKRPQPSPAMVVDPEREERIFRQQRARHERGEQILDNLPEIINEGRNRSAIWLGTYTVALFAAPFVIEGGGIALTFASRGSTALAIRLITSPRVLAAEATVVRAMASSRALRYSVAVGAAVLEADAISQGAPPGIPMRGSRQSISADAENLSERVYRTLTSAEKQAIGDNLTRAAALARGEAMLGTEITFRIYPKGSKYGFNFRVDTFTSSQRFNLLESKYGPSASVRGPQRRAFRLIQEGAFDYIEARGERARAAGLEGLKLTLDQLRLQLDLFAGASPKF